MQIRQPPVTTYVPRLSPHESDAELVKKNQATNGRAQGVPPERPFSLLLLDTPTPFSPLSVFALIACAVAINGCGVQGNLNGSGCLPRVPLGHPARATSLPPWVPADARRHRMVGCARRPVPVPFRPLAVSPCVCAGGSAPLRAFAVHELCSKQHSYSLHVLFVTCAQSPHWNNEARRAAG